MTITEQHHLALLRLALTEGKEVADCLSAEPLDWELLWTMAEEQCTFGLVADAMTLLPNGLWPERQTRLMWSGAARQLSERAEVVNSALADLVHLLEEEEITYVMVKGQTIAALYPHPENRQCGDVDFYIPASDYHRAKTVISQQLNVTIDGDEKADKHDSFGYRGVWFEMHYRLETFGTNKHQKLFDQLIDESLQQAPTYRMVGKKEVRILPSVEEVVLTFKHLFNHLLMEGVGLRQFCDMYLLIRKFDHTQTSRLEQQFKAIGYYQAFVALGAVLVKHFGLTEKTFPFPLRPSDYRWADSLLNVSLKRGNFGKHNRLDTDNVIVHKMDTALIALGHCICFLPLAFTDILSIVPRRIGIVLRNRLDFKIC